MHGDDSLLFRTHVVNRDNVIFPWSLSIVDCFFISNAFKALADAEVKSVALLRLSADGTEAEPIYVRDAYDLYDVDTFAGGSEVVLLHQPTSSACYWDPHERFVVVVGPKAFLDAARPYPADIEKHFYVEAMSHSSACSDVDSPEAVYTALCRQRAAYPSNL